MLLALRNERRAVARADVERVGRAQGRITALAAVVVTLGGVLAGDADLLLARLDGLGGTGRELGDLRVVAHDAGAELEGLLDRDAAVRTSALANALGDVRLGRGRGRGLGAASVLARLRIGEGREREGERGGEDGEGAHGGSPVDWWVSERDGSGRRSGTAACAPTGGPS